MGTKLKPFLKTDFQRPTVLHFLELRLQCFGFGFREELPALSRTLLQISLPDWLSVHEKAKSLTRYVYNMNSPLI